jgi:CubicO group peptidase (beta-lactamase class C family)
MKTIKWQCLAFLLVLAAFQPAAAETFPAAAPESQGMSADALQKLSAAVKGYLESDQIVGAELVVIKNRYTVHHETFGWRDREDGIKMGKNTLFNLRSMTKPLTGAAAQILIDEGKLKLTDPVADYLPGFKNSKSGAITIEQLLTHRSGLPLSILLTMEDLVSHDNLLSIANATGEKGPKFEPDEKFWYSDAGTEALGAVVEVVSGKSLEEFISQRLLSPLKMTDARHIVGQEPVNDPSVASLYGGGKGAWKRYWKPADPPFYPFSLGSQSLYGSPQDYARFLAMLMDGGSAGDKRLLSTEAVTRILTPASPMSTLGSDTPMPTGFPGCKVYYGQMAVLYLNEKSENPKKPVVFGHTGSDGTYAWAWPDRNLMVLFFTQSRGSASGLSLETTIHNLLIDPDAARGGDVISDELQPYLGEYLPKEAPLDAKPFKVLFQNGNLAVDVPDRMIFDLNGPDEEGRWNFKLSSDIIVSFSRDESDEVQGMRIAQLIKIMQDKPTAGEEISEEVPAEYRPWLGTYPLAMQGITLTVLYQEGSLAVNDPSEGIVKLRGPDEEGLWIDQYDKNQIYFERDAKGRIVLNLIANTRLTKVK